MYEMDYVRTLRGGRGGSHQKRARYITITIFLYKKRTGGGGDFERTYFILYHSAKV